MVDVGMKDFGMGESRRPEGRWLEEVEGPFERQGCSEDV